MSDASWALQAAVHDALSGNAVVKALIGDPPRIYDDPPADGAFPFLTVGEGRLAAWAGAARGIEHTLRLSAWSRYAGRKEIKDIMAAVFDVLHEASLSLDGHRLINLRFAFADIFRKQDGDTFEGVMRYRAVTEPIA